MLVVSGSTFPATVFRKSACVRCFLAHTHLKNAFVGAPRDTSLTWKDAAALAAGLSSSGTGGAALMVPTSVSEGPAEAG